MLLSNTKSAENHAQQIIGRKCTSDAIESLDLFAEELRIKDAIAERNRMLSGSRCMEKASTRKSKSMLREVDCGWEFIDEVGAGLLEIGEELTRGSDAKTPLVFSIDIENESIRLSP